MHAYAALQTRVALHASLCERLLELIVASEAATSPYPPSKQAATDNDECDDELEEPRTVHREYNKHRSNSSGDQPMEEWLLLRQFRRKIS